MSSIGIYLWLSISVGDFITIFDSCRKKPWYTYGVTVNVLVKFLLYENWISSMAALLCIGASKKTTKKLSENAPVYLKATWS